MALQSFGNAGPSLGALRQNNAASINDITKYKRNMQMLQMQQLRDSLLEQYRIKQQVQAQREAQRNALINQLLGTGVQAGASLGGAGIVAGALPAVGSINPTTYSQALELANPQEMVY